MIWVAQLSDFSDRKVRGIMKPKLGPVSCSSGEKKNLTRKSFEWETKFSCQIEFREPNPTARKEFRKSRNTLESQFSFGLIADRLAMLSKRAHTCLQIQSNIWMERSKAANPIQAPKDDGDDDIIVKTFVCNIFRFIVTLTIVESDWMWRDPIESDFNSVWRAPKHQQIFKSVLCQSEKYPRLARWHSFHDKSTKTKINRNEIANCT